MTPLSTCIPVLLVSPFARAEARKVDLIFEVDSFGMSELGKDASSLTGTFTNKAIPAIARRWWSARKNSDRHPQL